MQKIVVILFLLVSNLLVGQKNLKVGESNLIYPYVSDSSGFQFYNALVFYKKDKFHRFIREGAYVKFPLNERTYQGRWYMKSEPDSILIIRKESFENMIVSVSSLSNITCTDWHKDNGGQTFVAIAAVTLQMPGLRIFNPGKKWIPLIYPRQKGMVSKFEIYKEWPWEKEMREKNEMSK